MWDRAGESSARKAEGQCLEDQKLAEGRCSVQKSCQHPGCGEENERSQFIQSSRHNRTSKNVVLDSA